MTTDILPQLLPRIRRFIDNEVIPLEAAFGRSIFDMSVGYDLAGVRGDKVRGFISGMKDAFRERLVELVKAQDLTLLDEA